MFIILAALEPSEWFLFHGTRANNNAFCTECHISFDFYRTNRHNPTMGDLVVIGLCHLRTLFGTYEQFVGHLWNVFKISNVRRSLWNDTKTCLIF